MCYKNKILVIVLLSQILAEPQVTFIPRIANGYSCDTTAVPYFVIIRHRSGCGGSLITYSWVLTAAHCLIPKAFKGVIGKVHSGFDATPELKQVRKVKKVYAHLNYDEEAFYNLTDFRYDIGLVLVDEPFHETAATHVATLPDVGFTKRCNRVTTVGIGDTSDEEIWKTPAEQRLLNCVNLSIIDINTCRENHTTVLHFDTTRTICTYGEGIRGPCPGDSGGPLICDSVIIGIVSAGGGCSERTNPTVYTMVESYLDFIDHFVKFTRISIKEVRSNGTTLSGRKVSDKAPANIVQGRVPNSKLVLFTLLYFFFLYR